MERVLSSHWCWSVAIDCAYKWLQGANNSNQPIQNPLLFVTEPRTRDNINIVLICLDFFSIDLILPAALGPGVYSASNRNEYQELIK
jgi:hypothetical protein